MADSVIIQYDEGWKEIKETITKLQSMLDSDDIKGFTKAEYVKVYTVCYNMCTQRSPNNWSEKLYQAHGETIAQYLDDKVLPALLEKHDEYVLVEMVKRWKQHEIMDKWMRKFFMYLDRYYVKHHSHPLLKESSLEKFRTKVFLPVCHNFVAAVLSIINKEREGEVVDRHLLKDSVAVFESMKEKSEIYREMLETPLLASSRAFYAAKAQDWINQETLQSYLIKSEAALNAERERVDNYLVAWTKPKVVEVVQAELLMKYETTLLEKEGTGCRCLLQDKKSADLSRLFRLYQDIPDGLKPVANIVREHIIKMGEDIVGKRETVLDRFQETKNPKDKVDPMDPSFVQSLLDLHAEFQSLVNTEFQGHSLFQKALKEAFEVFINHDVGKVSNAELLSTFCDRILKTGGAKLSDSEMESNLESTVQLFSYLSEKDLFSEIYRNHLSKRLLGNRSASDDAERSMIAKLKLRCGAQFTVKMEGMVKDLLTGDDLKRAFKEQFKGSGGVQAEGALIADIDFSVEVLTTGHWPTYKMVDVALPETMTECMQVYQKFFDGLTQHRCLKWVHSLGNATIKATYKRPYDLQVTTLQAVALLTFNDITEWLSFEEIVERLHTDEEVCKRILHSLSCAKYKVLTKDPVSKGISRTDRFKVNESFQSPTRKFRIPMASLDESHNPKRVEEDRSIAIEAAIVRIMKTRKHMAHQQLISEVLSQLHFFKPEPRVVKKRIEHLIDREYLERDTERSNFYKYLA